MNDFQFAEVKVLEGSYSETKDASKVLNYLAGDGEIAGYSGTIEVSDGHITSNDLTLIHSRSFAEDVQVLTEDELPFSGRVDVVDGVVNNTLDLIFRGKSLISQCSIDHYRPSQEAFSVILVNI